MSKSMTALDLHGLNIPGFACFPEKKNYTPTKLFTWLMKMNIPLIMLFTRSRTYSDKGWPIELSKGSHERGSYSNQRALRLLSICVLQRDV